MTGDPDNSAPAIITSHPFEPTSDWWTVCGVCGLAEAAHADSVRYFEDDESCQAERPA